MPISQRLLSSLLSAIPALLFGACTLTFFREEYYWTTYAIAALIFISTSLILGFIIPTWLHGGKFNYPWLWLFIAGSMAWLITLLFLALLNLSPMCVGQDNGDGINNYSLCILYSVLAALLYSPVELVMLTLSAIIGGKILSALYKPGEGQISENLVR